MSRIGLVVPTLAEESRQRLLAQSLGSILSQQGVDLRVVVVTRHRSALVERLEGAGELTVVLQEGRGLSNALNLGIEALGTGVDYFGWLGDDDLLAAASLQTAALRLDQDRSAVMVYGRCRYIDASGDTLFVVRPTRVAQWFMRFGADFVPQPGSLMRMRDVVAVGGLDEALHYAMDLDLFLKLRKRGRISYVNRELASFRQHSESLTGTNPGPSVERIMAQTRAMSRAALASRSVWAPAAAAGTWVWRRVQWHDPRS